MRKIIVNIIGGLSCYITLFGQNVDNITGNYSHDHKSQLQMLQIMPIAELNCAYPTIILPTTILSTYENIPYVNWELKDEFRFKKIYLSIFSTRMINRGVADINNVGMGLFWQSTSKISIGWSAFISKQYGYNLNSIDLSLGLKMNINYHFNNKLNLSLWGQYLINQNADPFIRLDNNQPKNEIGLRLEYSPNINTRYSIGVSQKKSLIDSQKSLIQVEGKAGFKF